MKRDMKRLFLMAVVFIFFSLSACSKSDDGYSGGNNNSNNNNNSNSSSVSISSSSFSPATVTIKAGTTVTWTNNVNDVHTVTANDGSFNSGNLDYYKSFSRTFNQAGTFRYHCGHHANMKGSVVVNQ